MEVPDVIQHNVAQELRSLILTPADIEVIFKSLPIGKAADPDARDTIVLDLGRETPRCINTRILAFLPQIM